MKSLENLTPSWVDFAVVLLLSVGLWRGRKRGMSEELLDIVKWALIVLVAGFLYRPCAQLILGFTSLFSPLACHVTTYLSLALLIAIVFAVIRRGAGAKLVGSDTFGSAEYYLGMVSGMCRYACMILVGLSLLNARHYSPEEIKANTKYQEDNFGTTFFMTLPDLQQTVFTRSLSGRLAREYLPIVLIQPLPGGGKDLSGNNNIANARERSAYDVLDKK
jgi:uncharacterized membrane protein required for colicin V production